MNINIFLYFFLDMMIDQMRNKICDLESSIKYHYSNNSLNNKRSLSPSRSNFNTNDNSVTKFNSHDRDANAKYHFEYRDKSETASIKILKSENINLKEEIKSRDKIIFKLENQKSELQALNKTCHDLLGQLNI